LKPSNKTPTLLPISEAMDKMLKDGEFLQKCSENAQRLIKEKFLLSEKIKEYEKIYDLALKKD